MPRVPARPHRPPVSAIAAWRTRPAPLTPPFDVPGNAVRTADAATARPDGRSPPDHGDTPAGAVFSKWRHNP